MFVMLATLLCLLLTSCEDIESNPRPVLNPHAPKLCFCHANMRSIRKCPDKLDHIKAEFCGKYDVITISETWLTPDDNYDEYGKPLYSLEGYHDPIRRDRLDRRGGGVLAWISESLTYKRRADLEL